MPGITQMVKLASERHLLLHAWQEDRSEDSAGKREALTPRALIVASAGYKVGEHHPAKWRCQ
jgi:hypothetical protein